MAEKPAFLDFQVDHMTILLDPKLYNVAYAVFRIIFGIGPKDLLYEKRKEWTPGAGEESMTFAVRIGEGKKVSKDLMHTIIAVVQPTEPKHQKSHVRDMLTEHRAAAHWQHIALRTSDLLAFHQHALKRGVQFITPVLKDESEDLIQVFSGEWYFPGSPASGVFFEFLQRNPSQDQMKMLADRNREAWFRDKTFLGLYGEKENEYRSGKVTPFLPVPLFEQLHERVGNKKLWDISDADIRDCEQIMLKFGAK
jgi:hypothetical protein